MFQGSNSSQQMPSPELPWMVRLQQEIWFCEVFMDCVLSSLPATEKRLEEIEKAQKEDRVCTKVTEDCLTGWPGNCEADPHINPS